ncbi:MarR family winged helix-turn-helix transcriptional regulator [Georgenia sp. Z1344]|uniref:MarR family winged helix-turn-helix transcriptional regulator n=1 Tax=Georgenia sp. Z1344 TaxID=3416706 RepID=UPI003CEA2BFF
MNPTNPTQALALGRTMYRAFSSIQRWMDRDRRRRDAPDLSPVDGWLLRRIADTGPVRMSELAAWQEVDRSTMTVQIGRLTRRDLVARTPDPEDRRAVAVSITAEGRVLLDDYEDEVGDVAARLLAGWSTADVDRLTTLLGRLADTIDDDAVPPPTGATAGSTTSDRP